MKHVILGNGPAGIIAAETIRKHAPTDEIVVLGDEPGLGIRVNEKAIRAAKAVNPAATVAGQIRRAIAEGAVGRRAVA